jgi:hypothetical protein
MISGFPSVGRAAEAMKRGAMDYVSKPFTPEEIAGTVKGAIQRKLTEEKKALGRFKKVMQSVQFPTATMEDKPPQTIAETVASTVGVGKTTSPWITVFVLGILAGAYIGFGGLLSTTVTFDLPQIMGIGFTKLIAGSAFSVGLMLVVIAGAELFTGNNRQYHRRRGVCRHELPGRLSPAPFRQAGQAAVGHSCIIRRHQYLIRHFFLPGFTRHIARPA